MGAARRSLLFDRPQCTFGFSSFSGNWAVGPEESPESPSEPSIAGLGRGESARPGESSTQSCESAPAYWSWRSPDAGKGPATEA